MRNWLYLIDEGRITLQVSGIENDTAASKEWWCLLTSTSVHSPAIGREPGFEHLTKKGWEDNKHEIKTRFEAAISKRYSRCKDKNWVEFEMYVEHHFSEVERARNRKVALLTCKLDALKSFTV